MSYTVHTLETAPDAAKEGLEKARGAFGFIPNILGMMAESPALLKAYLGVAQAFKETAFDATEQQIVLLTTSYENECPYCMAAHSTSAAKQKVPEDVITALRDGTPIADAKLEALRAFTSAVVVTRGWPSADALAAFEAAGYTRANALDVVVGVGQKTLSNYANHLAETPLDTVFAAAAWQKTDDRAA